MLPNPKRQEINEHTIKLIVGLIAICLASLTSFFSQNPLQSISDSYWADGWSRDIFVGFLFAISAFLLSYNGNSILQMALSKIAAFAAMGVAMFPCRCVIHNEKIPYLHGVCAAVMFLILAIFCCIFFGRAWYKGHWRARCRAFIYAICGIIIVTSILIIAIDLHSDGIISSKITRIIFFSEGAALISFGIAWLIASRIFPIITRDDERITLSPFSDRGE